MALSLTLITHVSPGPPFHPGQSDFPSPVTVNGGRWCVVTLFIDFVRIIPWAQGIKGFKVSERRLLQIYEIDIMNFKVIS